MHYICLLFLFISTLHATHIELWRPTKEELENHPDKEGIEVVTPGFPLIALVVHEPGILDIDLEMSRPILAQIAPKADREAKHVRLEDPELATAYLSIDAAMFLPGEKISLSATTADGHNQFSFIPRPIEVTSKKDKQLVARAELITAIPTVYQLHIEGASTALILRSQSEQETINHPLPQQKGTITTLLMPGVSGKKGGFATITLSNNQGKLLSLRLPWGVTLLNYLTNKRPFKP